MRNDFANELRNHPHLSPVVKAGWAALIKIERDFGTPDTSKEYINEALKICNPKHYFLPENRRDFLNIYIQKEEETIIKDIIQSLERIDPYQEAENNFAIEAFNFPDFKERQAIFQDPEASKVPGSNKWPNYLIKCLAKNASGLALAKLQQCRKYFFTQKPTKICQRMVFYQGRSKISGATIYLGNLDLFVEPDEMSGSLIVAAAIDKPFMRRLLSVYKIWSLRDIKVVKPQELPDNFNLVLNSKIKTIDLYGCEIGNDITVQDFLNLFLEATIIRYVYYERPKILHEFQFLDCQRI